MLRDGAAAAGHRVERIDVGGTDVAFLRSQAELESGRLPDHARSAQKAIRRADHIVVFPLGWAACRRF